MDAPELAQLRDAAMTGHTDTDVDHTRGMCSLAIRMCRRLGVAYSTIGGGTPGPYTTPTQPGDVLLEQWTSRWVVAADQVARTIDQCQAQVVECVRAVLATNDPTPDPPPTSTVYVPAGVLVLWRQDSGWNDWPWEYEPKDTNGTRIPKLIPDPTGAGRGSVLSAYIPAGLKTKGRSEAGPQAPSATVGATAAFGYDIYLRDLDVNTSGWQVITQYAQSGYSPAFELKVGHGRFYLDGNNGSWHRDLAPAATGEWTNIAVQVRFDTDPTKAVFDAWVNGTQTVTGAHPSGAGTIYGKSHVPYPKQGLYASPGCSGEVLFDNSWWGKAT